MKLEPGKWLRMAKQAAAKNPSAVHDNLDKAEAFVNDKTGGKYKDKLASGGDALEKGLGVHVDQPHPPGGQPPGQAPETPTQPS